MALRLPKADLMASVEAPILPGSNVVVNEIRSIYNGYSGCVQRISGDRAAVLFEGGELGQVGHDPSETSFAGLRFLAVPSLLPLIFSSQQGD